MKSIAQSCFRSSFRLKSRRFSRGLSSSSSGRAPKVLVLGSSGATGSAIAYTLSRRLGAKILGADVIELPSDFSAFSGGWELDDFVPLPKTYTTLPDLTVRLTRGVDFFLQGKDVLDAIVVASGGWEGDPKPRKIATENDLEQGALEYAETIERMMKMNFDPVVAAGYIAQQFMGNNGLFVAIGAAPCLAPTPGMLGYGLAKNGAHHLIQTLGASTGKSLETKGIREQGRTARRGIAALETMSVIGILPTKIDTPSNRKATPNANFDEWTKPLDIASEISTWLDKPAARPHSGSLVRVYQNKNGSGATFALAR